MREDEASPGRRGRRPGAAYCPDLARRLCERVAAGELLYAVCREPGMPTPQTVGVWSRKRADFGRALSEARRAGGRAVRGGGVWRFCPATAEEIFERLCEGESLTAIGADPAMPCLSTIFYWRRRIAEFDQAVQVAKRIQAERFCDLGWELAQAATPETAYLTQVRLAQLRWTAGVLAPRVYRLKTQDPDTPRETLEVLTRRFEIEVDPQTGARRVVAYRPNPETGLAEREEPQGG